MLENIKVVCKEYGFKLVRKKGKTRKIVYVFENENVLEEYETFCIELDFALQVVRVWFDFEMGSYSYAGEYSMESEKEIIESIKTYMEETKVVE